MARVLCITLNPALDLAFDLDTLVPGAVNRSQRAHLEAAGKGVNVARVLAGLGHDVSVSGFLGADNDAPFRRAFEQLGVWDGFVRVPGETRINAKLAEASGRVTDINGPGIAVASDALATFQRQTDEALEGSDAPDAVLIAGSLPPGMALTDFSALLNRLKARHVPLWVDTSGEALRAAIEIAPAALKPNEVELAEWAGQTLDSHAKRLDAVNRLHRAGVANAMLSAGADGVLWASQGGVWQASPPRVEAVNTVCAGDTFVAGMLHGQLMGHSPETTLRFATALSAEAVRHVGVGDPNASDFTQLLHATHLQRLDAESAKGNTP